MGNRRHENTTSSLKESVSPQMSFLFNIGYLLEAENEDTWFDAQSGGGGGGVMLLSR